MLRYVHHHLNCLGTKPVILEQQRVGRESDDGAVRLTGILRRSLLRQVSFFELHSHHFAVAHTLHRAVCGEGVDSLQADTVQSDRLLEVFRIELAACVHVGGNLLHFTERYAASVVAHAYRAGFSDVNLDAFSDSHVELIDGIVHHLLEQDIDTVIRI